MAGFLALPADNLHLVPQQLSDQEACYAEPLAAACMIVEQRLLEPPGLGGALQAIAVVGGCARAGPALAGRCCWLG